MSERKWIVFKMPGIGDIVAWTDPDELKTGQGLVTLENVTRIVVNPRNGEIGFGKFSDVPEVFNLSAIPKWLDAPAEMVDAVAPMSDQIIVPKPGLRIDRG